MKKLVIITGASRGIGRAIMAKFAENDYQVLFTYKNSHKEANDFEKQYPNCKGYQVNHLEKAEIKSFVNMVTLVGTPTILINSVGINVDSMLLNQSFEKFWEIMELNFGSAVYLTQLLIPEMMRNRNGHIINISSVAANKPKIGNAAYGSSKAALERFSKTLALELARFNIRVNCIAPGFVKTDMLNTYLADKNDKEFFKQIPMRSALEVEDVANTVISICENKIKATGSVINLGNGENIS